MVWKNTQSTDGGNSKVWGGRDHDKPARMFNGELDVDNVAINLPNRKWEFETLSLLLRNRASAWGYNVSIPVLSGLSGHVQIGVPVLAQNDTLMTLNSPGEMKNKRVDFRQNTIIGGGSSGAASGSKTGSLVCGKQMGASAGDGILKGHIDRPTQPLATSDPVPTGNYWEYSTGGADVVAGIEYPWVFARRQFNARFKAKVRVPTTTTNSRMYIGWSSDLTTPAEDAPLADTRSGVIVGWRTIDNTIKIFHNGGSSTAGTSPNVFNTQIPVSTALRTIEVACRNEIPRVVVRIAEPSDAFGNETNVQTFNVDNNLPIEGFNLAPTCTMSSADATDRKFWVGGLEADMTM